MLLSPSASRFSLLQVLKVAILAEKYAVDYTWYVDTILNLIRIAGDYVSEEVWYRVIQIVINRDDVQGYAAKTVFEVSVTDSKEPLCVTSVAIKTSTHCLSGCHISTELKIAFGHALIFLKVSGGAECENADV